MLGGLATDASREVPCAPHNLPLVPSEVETVTGEQLRLPSSPALDSQGQMHFSSQLQATLKSFRVLKHWVTGPGLCGILQKSEESGLTVPRRTTKGATSWSAPDALCTGHGQYMLTKVNSISKTTSQLLWLTTPCQVGEALDSPAPQAGRFPLFLNPRFSPFSSKH